ncbi:MAG TPA: M20/M25/M40 family metallo-hydrolase [Ignavibacteria bacterium]|nr:M20/M25/M40 family metallo-hydrolase [Ignavibacteria bacterium]HMR40936.1 M20/M25/M40 family metallo-hydrolase [Ignavibacteria bacterium]
MNIDSTSGSENSVADFLISSYNPEGSELEVIDIENGKKNLFYKWGKPEIIFCSHFDTVPPYIPPSLDGDLIKGRGSCDAKGQIAVLAYVCEKLFEKGHTNFGLLMLAGEEVGSYGAIAANKVITGSKYVIVGEPTENKLIRASKGNILAEFVFKGRSCHSGYPENGDDAVMRMSSFIERLRRYEFTLDEILGETTFNIGKVVSDNAHNVVSEKASLKIFFRTTKATHDHMKEIIPLLTDELTEVNFKYGDRPMDFVTVDGFETGVVSYGSDAPELYNLGECLLYGPGSILDAHTVNEKVKISDMNKAVDDLIDIYEKLKQKLN